MDLGLCGMLQWGRVGKQDQSYEWNQVNARTCQCAWHSVDFHWLCWGRCLRVHLLLRFAQLAILSSKRLCWKIHRVVFHQAPGWSLCLAFEIIVKLLSSTWKRWHQRLPSPLRRNDQRVTQVSLWAGAAIFFPSTMILPAQCAKEIRSKSMQSGNYWNQLLQCGQRVKSAILQSPHDAIGLLPRPQGLTSIRLLRDVRVTNVTFILLCSVASLMNLLFTVSFCIMLI